MPGSGTSPSVEGTRGPNVFVLPLLNEVWHKHEADCLWVLWLQTILTNITFDSDMTMTKQHQVKFGTHSVAHFHFVPLPEYETYNHTKQRDRAWPRPRLARHRVVPILIIRTFSCGYLKARVYVTPPANPKVSKTWKIASKLRSRLWRGSVGWYVYHSVYETWKTVQRCIVLNSALVEGGAGHV